MYLGLDCSTQGLKAIVLDTNHNLIAITSINFDKDLPHYETTGGAYIKGLEATVPSIMFAEAMDVVMEKLKREHPNLDMSKIAAVSTSAQQHGSIYWKKGAEQILRSLNSSKSLREQLRSAFAIPNGPIWMDSSTEKECRNIEKIIGGAKVVAGITGSRAYERFTASQLRKQLSLHKKEILDTERISLVSSMISSLLIGSYAPIDTSDASGMNLMNLLTKEWSWKLMKGISGSGNVRHISRIARLFGGMDGVVSCHKTVGRISNYFQRKYGFSPSCDVIVGTGDNPSSLFGLQSGEKGCVTISLGTSDTLFYASRDLLHSSSNNFSGHILANPLNPETYIKMLCFKNGSLTREKVRNHAVGRSWVKYNDALKNTPPGNKGNIGLYFLEPEIIPTFNVRKIIRFDPSGKPVSSFPAEIEIRAQVESHFLSMKKHSVAMGMSKPIKIVATGGASKNKHLLQIISDIFEAPIYTHKFGPDSAAFGAALRAQHGTFCSRIGVYVPFTTVSNLLLKSPGTMLEIRASPRPDTAKIYRKMLKIYSLKEELSVSLFLSSQNSF